jgi:hypothetical protein
MSFIIQSLDVYFLASVEIFPILLLFLILLVRPHYFIVYLRILSLCLVITIKAAAILALS